MVSDDPKAVNTAENPENVIPNKDGDASVDGGKVRTVLQPLSWNVIRLKK